MAPVRISHDFISTQGTWCCSTLVLESVQLARLHIYTCTKTDKVAKIQLHANTGLEFLINIEHWWTHQRYFNQRYTSAIFQSKHICFSVDFSFLSGLTVCKAPQLQSSLASTCRVNVQFEENKLQFKVEIQKRINLSPKWSFGIRLMLKGYILKTGKYIITWYWVSSRFLESFKKIRQSE